ncbi:hypothetical protein [Tenacibaculum sp. nBUS_03]|uniref:hypothetical protein n=1 Tax=Tenacibaculum sp. nBUS_03 TaxID=3395320 RepID=UPI003EB9E64F
MINLIMVISTSIICGGIIWYSEIKSNQKLKKEFTGRYKLKANISYKILGILSIIISVILINIMIMHWSEEIQILAPIATCIFLIPGIYTLMFYYNYSIEFNESRILSTNWRGAKKNFKWSDIINVKFIESIKCLYVKSNSGKILINQDSVGFIILIEMMELKTGYKFKKQN